MKKTANELPLEEALRWTVEPRFRRQSKADADAGLPKELKDYALLYGGVVQKKATGERDVERMREMASFCNKRSLVPRPAVQCLADTNIAPLPKRRDKSPSLEMEPIPQDA